MAQYVCLECGWVYSEAAGCPERGIPPGTLWELLPDRFKCGECETKKSESHKWKKIE
jgi:rubredoxin